jgi:hypothetical protein
LRNEEKVQIEQHQDRSAFPAATPLARQGRPAAEYVAVFSARLALARWMRGGDIPHVLSSTHDDVPARAAWYAQAQNQFQSWLEDGGFHRPEPDSLPGTH